MPGTWCNGVEMIPSICAVGWGFQGSLSAGEISDRRGNWGLLRVLPPPSRPCALLAPGELAFTSFTISSVVFALPPVCWENVRTFAQLLPAHILGGFPGARRSGTLEALLACTWQMSRRRQSGDKCVYVVSDSFSFCSHFTDEETESQFRNLRLKSQCGVHAHPQGASVRIWTRGSSLEPVPFTPGILEPRRPRDSGNPSDSVLVTGIVSVGLLVEFIYLFIVLAGLGLCCSVQRSVVVAHGFSCPCTCWERSRAGGEGGDRGWDGGIASPTQWTWVWGNSGRWWWAGKPGVLQSMGSQRGGHDWAITTSHAILDPWTGIEPTSPALEGRFLTSGPPEESLHMIYFFNPHKCGHSLHQILKGICNP